MLRVYKTLCTLLNMRVLLLSKLVAFRSVTKISSCRVNGISSRRETGQLFSFFLSFFLSYLLTYLLSFFLSLFFFFFGGGGSMFHFSPHEVAGDASYSGFRPSSLSYNPHIHARMHLQRNSTRERSPIDKKIWYSIQPRKFGCDVSVRPNANRNWGREGGDYDMAEVKNFAFRAPRSFQG